MSTAPPVREVVVVGGDHLHLFNTTVPVATILPGGDGLQKLGAGGLETACIISAGRKQLFPLVRAKHGPQSMCIPPSDPRRHSRKRRVAENCYSGYFFVYGKTKE